MNSTSTVVGRIVIPHGAFTLADTQLEQLFVCAQRNEGAEGMAILGESGTGKTTLLERFIARHKPHRNDDGMEVPVLFASVPLGDHPKAAIDYHFKTGHREPA
jgi:ABC-type phosphate/phosphonate transport system ATPase subunit